jgi:hypothetical protein
MQTNQTPETPAEIMPHANKYIPDAWRDYTVQELGQWVHLLHKRASHRADAEKKAKDIDDAKNYWRMIGKHLDAA